MEQRLRRHLKPMNNSWRVDETYIRAKGKWVYIWLSPAALRRSPSFCRLNRRNGL
jgi:transposase, IS6 family